LLKETTDAFDGVSNPRPPQYESDVNPLRHAARVYLINQW